MGKNKRRRELRGAKTGKQEVFIPKVDHTKSSILERQEPTVQPGQFLLYYSMLIGSVYAYESDIDLNVLQLEENYAFHLNSSSVVQEAQTMLWTASSPNLEYAIPIELVVKNQEIARTINLDDSLAGLVLVDDDHLIDIIYWGQGFGDNFFREGMPETFEKRIYSEIAKRVLAVSEEEKLRRKLPLWLSTDCSDQKMFCGTYDYVRNKALQIPKFKPERVKELASSGVMNKEPNEDNYWGRAYDTLFV